MMRMLNERDNDEPDIVHRPSVSVALIPGVYGRAWPCGKPVDALCGTLVEDDVNCMDCIAGIR